MARCPKCGQAMRPSGQTNNPRVRIVWRRCPCCGVEVGTVHRREEN